LIKKDPNLYNLRDLKKELPKILENLKARNNADAIEITV
jgi:hypothetical protein